MMHQKLSDFELIIDENSNDHIDALRIVKTELEFQKNKNFENEKFFDVLNYFFKKMQIHYGSYDKVIGLSESAEHTSGKIFNDTKSFQNKLIDLENFIIKILNERSMLHHKYSKILDIQTKMTNNESIEGSQLHLENIKKLNEKMLDLKEENNLLKKQIQDNYTHNRQTEPTKEKDQYSFKYTKDFEDNLEKENIFTNNYIKDREESNNKKLKNFENVRKSTAGHKTLEERVFELERELNLYERSEDSKSQSQYGSELEKYSNKRNLNIIDNKLRRSSKPVTNKSSYYEVMKSPSINRQNRSLIHSDFDVENQIEINEKDKNMKNKLKKSIGLEKNNLHSRDKSEGIVSRKDNINKGDNKKLKPSNELKKGKPIEKIASKKKKKV